MQTMTFTLNLLFSNVVNGTQKETNVTKVFQNGRILLLPNSKSRTPIDARKKWLGTNILAFGTRKPRLTLYGINPFLIRVFLRPNQKHQDGQV